MFRFRLCDLSDMVDVAFCDLSDVCNPLTKVPFCDPPDVFDALTKVPFFFRVSAGKAALAALTLWRTIIRVHI